MKEKKITDWTVFRPIFKPRLFTTEQLELRAEHLCNMIDNKTATKENEREYYAICNTLDARAKSGKATQLYLKGGD